MSDGDILIPVLTVLIAAFGVLMVYSASSYTAEATYGDAFFFAKKQLLGFVLGTVGMIAVSFFPYTKLQKLKWAALGVSVVLLAVLFIPGVGKENYGATRWINLGPLTIQPSEIAKYGFVIFAASYMSEKPERMKTFVGMLPVLGAGGGICLLVILEPNCDDEFFSRLWLEKQGVRYVFHQDIFPSRTRQAALFSPRRP